MSKALNSAVAEMSSTTKEAPVEVFRSDYKPLTNIVTKINMDFDITDGKTTITSEMTIEPNPKSTTKGDLVLDGDESCVKLMVLQVDGKDLVEGDDYELSPGKLVVKESALDGEGKGLLKTVVETVPEENTQLSGLYKSGPMYCTQCEAMGFRRITYYP
jgi:aminopeptidase N